jgi:hypothetical protein
MSRSGSQSGIQRWTLPVTFPRSLHTGFWDIGVRTGSTVHVIRVKIVG